MPLLTTSVARSSAPSTLPAGWGAALPVLAVGFAAPAIGLLPAAWIFTAVIAVISLGATVGLLKLKHTTAGG